MKKSLWNSLFSAALLSLLLLPGCTAPNIWDSAAFGDIEAVEALLDANPELVNARNKNEKTPIFFAISMNRADIFELLVARGADIHAADMTGLTPLHVAVFVVPYKNNAAIAERLVALGADLEAKDKFGDTPLHVAAYKNSPELVDLLVRLGAKLDAANNDGLTPYQIAQKYEQARTIERLKTLTEAAG